MLSRRIDLIDCLMILVSERMTLIARLTILLSQRTIFDTWPATLIYAQIIRIAHSAVQICGSTLLFRRPTRE